MHAEPVFLTPDDGAVYTVHDTDTGRVSVVASTSRTDAGEDETMIEIAGTPCYIFGTPTYTRRVRSMLRETSPVHTVPVFWSGWEFTPKRDTLPDAVAAMIAAVGPRCLVSASARRVMLAAMPELTDPDNNRDDVIY